MLPLTILPLGIFVLALAACGIAGTSGLPDRRSSAEMPALTCALAVTERGGQLQMTGQLRAARPVSGRYALTIAQTGRTGQNLIDQSGDFQARAGETVTLGSANISGSMAGFAATLTVEYAQVTLDCPITLS